ncbi:uncharacterized protein LOC143340991 [Colletes latitarsis]|uniref:uncharacterized protein LOC143340991 n=1 Tax=Colletes latitarsis TaxID=2605962 RepID=UPI0040373E94
MDLLEKYGLADCNPVATPMDKNTVLNNAKGNGTKKRPYRELVGALMYLAVATRPDIAYAVSALAQFNECYGDEHWAAAKRVLRYLKGTINHGITFRNPNEGASVYVDADWGRCQVDRKSYTGSRIHDADRGCERGTLSTGNSERNRVGRIRKNVYLW